MRILKIRIENYKCFREFELNFKEGTNIIVGDNEAGKSTILESIHLALTGLLGGRYLRNELSQHLFNNGAVNDYIRSLRNPPPLPPPAILIEIYLDGDYPQLLGNGNSCRAPAIGFFLKIAFDERYQQEYQELLKKKNELDTLPIEYYDITWTSFARETISPRFVPLKSALIDSSSARYQNGSDIYISRACVTIWGLGGSLVPEVIDSVGEGCASQGDDCVCATYGPFHAGLFESMSYEVLAACLYHA